MTTILVGQAAQFTVTVRENGAPVALDPAGTVTYQLFTADGATAIGSSHNASAADAGADWPNGVVAIALSASDTGGLAIGAAMLVVLMPGRIKRFKLDVESAAAPTHSSLFVKDFVVEELRGDQLLMAAASVFPSVQVSDDYLWGKVLAAESDIAHTLRVSLVPTRFFPLPPSDADVAALNGMPWAEDPGYDYEAGMFMPDKWGFIRLRNRPLISVERMALDFPTVGASGFADIPMEWLRIDKKQGDVRLVPSSPVLFSASGTFAMLALTGYQMVPQMVKITYTAGLEDARRDYPELLDAIKKKAVLKAIEDAFLPQSGSISADGLSQSMSVDMDKYRDTIESILFGPKGSNGGLMTALHGIRVG